MQAGVTVLVRDSLVRSGKLQVHADRVTPAPSGDPATIGRLLRVPLRWGRHDFDVIGVYMHASSYLHNVTLIEGIMQQWCADAPGGRVVVLGDFNFVPSVPLDRRHLPQHTLGESGAGDQAAGPPRAATRDTAPAAAWRRCLPALRDVWRERHPRRVALTYFHVDSASRLDRVYVHDTLVQQVVSARHADQLPSVSDHTPVVVQLLPGQPGVFGPGLPRLRMSLLCDPQCQQDLADWLTAQAASMPTDPLVLVQQWWLPFKDNLRTKVQELNRAARDRRAGQPQATQRRAAWEAVTAARSQVAECQDPAQLPAAMAQLQAATETLAQLLAEEEAVLQQRRREQWVHAGERPHPVMTKMVRPSQGASFFAGLHAPGSGHLVVDGVGLAGIVGSRYAEISTAPQVSETAQQTVLQAMAQHSSRLSAGQAAELGAQQVTPEEV